MPATSSQCHQSGTMSGFDFAGCISSLSSAMPPSTFSEGDKVYGLSSMVPMHSNAEYVTTDWHVLAWKLAHMSWEDAAALPLVGLTTWEMLVEQLEVTRDQGALLVVNGSAPPFHWCLVLTFPTRAGRMGSVAPQITSNSQPPHHMSCPPTMHLAPLLITYILVLFHQLPVLHSLLL